MFTATLYFLDFEGLLAKTLPADPAPVLEDVVHMINCVTVFEKQE